MLNMKLEKMRRWKTNQEGSLGLRGIRYSMFNSLSVCKQLCVSTKKENRF